MLAFVTSNLLPALAATVMQSLLLCALVLAACRWLPGLPATARCTLWWLVSLQLLAGLAWQAPLELPLLPAAVPTWVAVTPSPAEPSTVVAMVAPASALGAASPPPTGTPDLLTWLGLAWLAGVGLHLLHRARALVLTRRRLQRARPCTWPVAVGLLDHLAGVLAIRRPPMVRVSPEIRSPQLLGLWRPTILLPAEAADWSAQDLRLALHHELAHLRRRDLAWGWVPALAECAFFFHPLARLATREYALAREAACDAAVLAGADEHAQAYGRLLVRLGTSPRPCAGLTGASPTFTALKRRLLMLQARTASAPAAMTVLTVALVVLGTLPYRLVAAPVLASARSTSSTHSSSSTTITGSNVRLDNVLLFDQDRAQMSGSTDDLAAARALRDGKPLWWARKNGTAYVVRDAATLERVRAAYGTLQAIGREQGQIGTRQGEIGTKQGELGIRMSEVGIAQSRLALAREDSRSPRGAALEVQQNGLAREMEELSVRMEALSREQEKLSRRMQAATAEMQQDLIALLDQAIARGTAQPTGH